MANVKNNNSNHKLGELKNSKNNKSNKKNNDVKVSNLALIFAILAFIILLVRIGYLTLATEVDGVNLQAFASTRTTKKIILPAKRGTIYDSNGNVLSQDVSSYTLIAYLDESRTIDDSKPQHVVDKENTALVLSAIIDLDYDTILKYLSKENVYQTEFGPKGKGLTEIVKDRIKNINLPGIDFIETTKRYYPYGDFASYLVGYAKQKEDGTIVGELGVEKYFDEELTGSDGYTIYQKDRKGYKIAGTKEITQEAIDGSDVYLTIDNNVQFFVEEAMSKTTDYKYDSMTIVMAEAKTGKILAYATTPSFDPNKRNITNYLDSVSGIAFEPGSTMKIYTYMAALEAGVYDGKAIYQSGTYTTTDKTVIKDWNKVGWGKISYDQGFVYSSNTAVVNLMDKYMDANTLKKYLLKLGFGTKTMVNVPLEQSGKIDFKYETEIFNAAFGQGITTTPIQHIKALTSIANDGELLKPYLVSKVVDSSGKVILENGRTVLGTVASYDTIAYIKNLMWRTINDSDGAARSYAIKGYDIIGKTGTAQIASTNGKGYLTGSSDLNRSVAIMFPKDSPEIILYGVVKRSSTSTPLSNAVKEIITNVSKYYNIYNPEEETQKANSIVIENYNNKNLDQIKNELSNDGLSPVVLGDGNQIINQYPNQGTTLVKGDKVFLLTNSNNIKMPNIIGYSKSEVIALANLLKIEYLINGNGYVVTQNIKENTSLNKEMKLEVNLHLLYTS